MYVHVVGGGFLNERPNWFTSDKTFVYLRMWRAVWLVLWTVNSVGIVHCVVPIGVIDDTSIGVWIHCKFFNSCTWHDLHAANCALCYGCCIIVDSRSVCQCVYTSRHWWCFSFLSRNQARYFTLCVYGILAMPDRRTLWPCSAIQGPQLLGGGEGRGGERERERERGKKRWQSTFWVGTLWSRYNRQQTSVPWRLEVVIFYLSDWYGRSSKLSFQLRPSRNISRHISLTWSFPHRHQHARFPVDVTELLHRLCCWTPDSAVAQRNLASPRYWRYRNMIDWLTAVVLYSVNRSGCFKSQEM